MLECASAEESACLLFNINRVLVELFNTQIVCECVYVCVFFSLVYCNFTKLSYKYCSKWKRGHWTMKDIWYDCLRVITQIQNSFLYIKLTLLSFIHIDCYSYTWLFSNAARTSKNMQLSIFIWHFSHEICMVEAHQSHQRMIFHSICCNYHMKRSDRRPTLTFCSQIIIIDNKIP